jgi:thiol-disulfide isomerase/thioredoxin
MRKLLFFFFINLLALPAFADISFLEGDLSVAKERASREGKLIFLDFWASYCTPCKIMEEYTFTHPSVSDYVNDNYIPVKVDIQTFDGFDLKSQFDVRLLPTIIVLNSKGIVVGKHEETMGAEKFVETLRSYDKPKNRVKRAATTNMNYNASTGYSNAKPVKTSYATSSNTGEPKAKTSSNTAAAKGNLKPISSESVGTGSFTIQAGAFFSEESGRNAAKLVKRKYGQDGIRVFMSQRDENDKMVYRILVGQFSSKQEAVRYMKAHKIQGLIRNLDAYK